jgi:Flp pilus assembly protein TadG
MVPLFLLFLLAIDGGMFFYSYVTAAHAVREGARCGAVGGSTSAIQTQVTGNFAGGSPIVTVSRTDLSSPPDGIGPGDRITVSASWTYTWVSPMASFGLSPTTSKTYTTKMRLETGDTSKGCS